MRNTESMRQKIPVAKSHYSVCFWRYGKIVNIKIISFNCMDKGIIAMRMFQEEEAGTEDVCLLHNSFHRVLSK